MVKRANRQTPVKGGVRRKRNSQPKMQATSADSSIVKYSALGSGLVSDANGRHATQRYYCGGSSSNIRSIAGPVVVAAYSTFRFMPGSKMRWEPNVSFTTPGRIYCGFITNPEVMSTYLGLTSVVDQIQLILGLSSVQSFPVWQETEVQVPTVMRRKRFDCNETIINNVDVLDRSVQTLFVYCVEGGPASTAVGSFWYHDVVDVEGIHGVVT